MEILQTDRRVACHGEDVVQKALLVQARLGSIGAVEYLKSRDVHGAVIGRVLTSAQVRAGDRAHQA